MRILLTGSNGFIGSNILRSLNKKYSFIAPSHKELDLLDEKATISYFKIHPVDVVIHCAVIGGNRTDQYVKEMFCNNIRMFFNIVSCRKYYKRMIYIGSGAIYDKRYDIRKVKEETINKRVPVDEYGLYKYICAQYIEETSNFVDLRVFGIFGKGEDYRHRFISNIICKNIFGLPIVMNQNLYFDYIDIQDFVKIIDHFIVHKPRYKAYNIGTGIRRSLKSIATEITAIIPGQQKIIVKKDGLGHEYTGDITRLKNEIPSLHFIPLRQSIKDLCQWYLTQKKQIQSNSLV